MSGKKNSGTNIGIRFPVWQYEALEEFQKRNGLASISEVVRFLVECALNDRGYYRADYEPSIKDGVLSPKAGDAGGIQKKTG
jgi:hypothetical protein